MKKILLPILCTLLCVGLFAQNEADTQSPIANSQSSDKYTFGDFFDALDLPTVLGAGITPNGIEGATFNSAMRLGWRHHKNYGTFVYITYDTHSNKYDSLTIQGSNIHQVLFYRAAMTPREVRALARGKMLRSSLEIYCPLLGGDTTNYAQTMNCVAIHNK